MTGSLYRKAKAKKSWGVFLSCVAAPSSAVLLVYGIDEGGMRFQIVSPHEMDLEAGKISLKSPIGAALMGKKVGEIAEARVPSGTLRLRIESITLDEG